MVAKRTHGMSATSIYRTWQDMRRRCENPDNRDYRWYGGRGIGVCARWQSFENFYADMGPRLSPKHSIDRYPNNKGNYEPGNCRWATRTEQRANQRPPRWHRQPSDQAQEVAS